MVDYAATTADPGDESRQPKDACREAQAPRIAVFGAGAVGRTLAGWLSEAGVSVTLVGRPKSADEIAKHGLRIRAAPDEHARTVRLRTTSQLTIDDEIDVLFVCVKTYDLDAVGAQLGPAQIPLVVGLQNGVENQKILPKYFRRVIYGIVSYNAWFDTTGAVSYQSKGPILLGTPDSSLGRECFELSQLLSSALRTHYTARFEDAAHTKLVVNLANSFQTLVGHPLQPFSDRRLAQVILSKLLWEGVQIVKAAGYREHPIENLPTWWLMRLSATLPAPFTRRAFNRALAKLTLSSMAQDMLLKGGAESELETINGRMIELAQRHHVAAPFNHGIYRLCRERFRPAFKPIDVREVWAALQP